MIQATLDKSDTTLKDSRAGAEFADFPSLLNGVEGIFMERVAEQPLVEHYNRERRAYNDVTTWLAEAMDGSMRTPFEYYFDGHELYAEDGEALSQFFEQGIRDAREIKQRQPNLAFELRRRLIERDEYHDMLKMARGELPNTMVTVSDFPPELMEATQDIGGYNVSRKQTMLRVIVRKPGGVIRMYSQSLDGSNRQALEAIYEQLGYRAQPGELLGQRVHTELDSANQEFVVDALTGVYDRSLEAQTGMVHKAGQPQLTGRKSIETYQFVCAQTDLVQRAVDKVLTGQFDSRAMYEIVATTSKRYENACTGIGLVDREPVAYNSYDPMIEHILNQEIEQATTQARSQGKTFSGCGATVGAETQLSTEEQLSATGYGNKTSKDCDYISKKCPKCGTKNVKTHETATRISGSCGCSAKK